MEHLKNIADKINNLSLRERAMVFIGLIAVIFTLWDSFFMSPLALEQKKILADINKNNAERMVLVAKIQESIEKSNEDPDAENVEKLKVLRTRLIDIQAELESSTDNLVTPNDMPKILETVLHKTGDLTLNNLKSLGVTPLVAEKEPEKDVEDKSVEDETQLTADNIDNAYKHGLRIEFNGDYLTTLNYLKRLEELEWGFFWDNFELNVGEYPDAKASIEIFTLSLKEEWIGV